MEEYKKNCFFCALLGSDDDGSDYPSDSWPICNNDDPRQWLKSFPFKKEQKCHSPNFWAVLEVDKEMIELYEKYDIHDDDLDIDNWKSAELFDKKYDIAKAKED